MRPLETKATKEARERRNKTIMGIFIVVIMILSTIGFVLWQRTPTEQNENIRKYNNYTFVRVENGWQTETTINNKKIYLTTFYFPEELENITVNGKPFLSDFAGKSIYIIANSLNERRAAGELASALENFVQRMQLACSEEEMNETFCLDNNLPIKSCSDVSQQSSIIFIDDSINETAIAYNNGCLMIKGQDIELIKASDKALFMIFGIIK